MDKTNTQHQVTVCDKNLCSGCGVCVNKCHVGAVSIQHELFSINTVIDTEKCVQCNVCHCVCPNVAKVQKREPIEWRRGWANNRFVRKQGSSGGILSAVIEGFIAGGNYVCTCIFQAGAFKYVLTDKIGDLKKAPGSKYVKSNTNIVYEEVRLKLKTGNKVLFIGLPCQVAGVLNYVGLENRKLLYTVDMLCHGTPSKELFDQFLAEQGVAVSNINSVSFREKNDYEIRANTQYFSTRGTLDYYSLAFINGISYTDNCYSCIYATVERISDITVGDSWIKDNYKEELKNGISLIMVMTEKGRELLVLANASYVPADKENEMKVKPELSHPTVPLGDKAQFRQDILNGKSIEYAVIRVLPYKVFKQKVKGLLLRLGIIKCGEGVIFNIYVEK